jgi:hypothetical protein
MASPKVRWLKLVNERIRGIHNAVSSMFHSLVIASVILTIGLMSSTRPQTGRLRPSSGLIESEFNTAPITATMIANAVAVGSVSVFRPAGGRGGGRGKQTSH